MAKNNFTRGAHGRFTGSTGGHGGGDRGAKLAALQARVKAASAALEKTRSAQRAAATERLRASMFQMPKGTRVRTSLPDRAGTFTVRLSALAGAKRPPGAGETHREGGIREAIARGIKFKPIEVTRTKGRLDVNDGNNRLAVARERGEQFVRVRLSQIRERRRKSSR